MPIAAAIGRGTVPHASCVAPARMRRPYRVPSWIRPGTRLCRWCWLCLISMRPADCFGLARAGAFNTSEQQCNEPMDSAAAPATGRPRVGISRCLLGDDVRYDGGHKRDALLLEALGPHVEWVSVCPEVEVGLGVPREPIHLVAASDGVVSGQHRVRLVGVDSGRDWTAAMDRWRRHRMRELVEAGLAGYVLKQDSPSCGLNGVRIESRDGIMRAGRGLFAQALLDAMPDLPIEEEGRLHDPRMCDEFLERVRAYYRDRCLRIHG